MPNFLIVDSTGWTVLLFRPWITRLLKRTLTFPSSWRVKRISQMKNWSFKSTWELITKYNIKTIPHFITMCNLWKKHLTTLCNNFISMNYLRMKRSFSFFNHFYVGRFQWAKLFAGVISENKKFYIIFYLYVLCNVQYLCHYRTRELTLFSQTLRKWSNLIVIWHFKSY